MTSLKKLAAAIGLAAACRAASTPASYAGWAKVWVPVEFKYKAGGKSTSVVIDLPVQDEKDATDYCARYLSVGERFLADTVQQDHPELAKARFTGARCVTEGGKIKLVSNPTNRLPKVKLPPPPVADPAKSTASGPVTYMVDLFYEKVVDGIRPHKVFRMPMRAVSVRAAEEMCGGFQNMLRLSRNVLEKNPYALGLTGSWMASGGKCVTGKNGFIELTAEKSSGGSN
jgi:hypothetical protein